MTTHESKKTKAMPVQHVLKAQYVSITTDERDMLNDYLESELIEREEQKRPRMEMHPLKARTVAFMVEQFNQENNMLEVMKDLKMAEVFIRRLLRDKADPDYGNCAGTLEDLYKLFHGFLRNGLFIRGVSE